MWNELAVVRRAVVTTTVAITSDGLLSTMRIVNAKVMGSSVTQCGGELSRAAGVAPSSAAP